jgi:glutathione peroxidase
MKEEKKQPALSFYDLEATRNNGETFEFAALKGKKVLVVNTASNCGYTGQYAELQDLYNRYKNEIEILAFPANDFKEQEKGTDAEIAEFCRLNFGIGFPLMKKTSVIAGEAQHPVYRWLTDPAKNGWNSRTPEWNFSKYLVDEQGRLTHYFGASVSPLDDELISAIREKK